MLSFLISTSLCAGRYKQPLIKPGNTDQNLPCLVYKMNNRNLRHLNKESKHRPSNQHRVKFWLISWSSWLLIYFFDQNLKLDFNSSWWNQLKWLQTKWKILKLIERVQKWSLFNQKEIENDLFLNKKRLKRQLNLTFLIRFNFFD